MEPQALLSAFCRAVEAGDGPGFAGLFAEDGVYHDLNYGTFTGRGQISDMLTGRFHRDARDFRWDMLDPVSDGTTLYARYVFSFTSRRAGAEGRRAIFEGVSIMTLRDGLIATYREISNLGPGLLDLGVPPERVQQLLARQGAALKRRPEAARHRSTPSQRTGD
jgi:ketosteroid isomerase-like protein